MLLSMDCAERRRVFDLEHDSVLVLVLIDFGLVMISRLRYIDVV